MFFDQKITPYTGLRILEAISPLPLCLSGGDQMMPQGIIRNSLNYRWCLDSRLEASSENKGLINIYGEGRQNVLKCDKMSPDFRMSSDHSVPRRQVVLQYLPSQYFPNWWGYMNLYQGLILFLHHFLLFHDRNSRMGRVYPEHAISDTLMMSLKW